MSEPTPQSAAPKPSSAGRVLGTLVVIAIIVAGIYWLVQKQNGPSESAMASSKRLFVCSETHKSFDYALKDGDTIPVLSPFSGKKTGYPAELCYWTKDGQVKNEPTAVLTNEAMGQPGPTFCPDCGRLVVPHNPRPGPDAKAPPTKEEYAAAMAAAATAPTAPTTNTSEK